MSVDVNSSICHIHASASVAPCELLARACEQFTICACDWLYFGTTFLKNHTILVMQQNAS